MRARLFLSCFCLLALFASCIPDPEEAARLTEKLSEQIEIAEGVNILYSDSARIRVAIQADIMENILDFKDPHQRFPNGIRITFIDDFGDTTSVLTAKEGVYRERLNEVVVRDSVVWKSADQRKLETDELTWTEESQQIDTDRFVVITQPDYIIYGYGLTAKQDFSDARVKQVTGRVPVNRPED
ncbi:MAG: LPS export ABC transporter periplasmic protein LptC [Bacteroidota bacterium]